MAFLLVYCLGVIALPAGASLGLQASGLPSGAQHDPVTAPCGDVKPHASPLRKDLHAANASGGGLCGPPLPSAGCAESAQHALNATALAVNPNARPKDLVIM